MVVNKWILYYWRPINVLMKYWTCGSIWAYSVKLKSRIKTFFQNINFILYRAAKWINLFLNITANKPSPGQFVIWNRAWPPRFWHEFGNFDWNFYQSKALPEPFHAANLNVFFFLFFILRRYTMFIWTFELMDLQEDFTSVATREGFVLQSSWT